MKILVVDDSPMARMQVRMLLEQHGHTVVGEAGDAAAACEAYERLKPDAMTLDMIMPGGGGIEVLKNLQGVTPPPKVVVVSSLNDQALEVAKDLGAKHILRKPVEWEPLEKALAELGA